MATIASLDIGLGANSARLKKDLDKASAHTKNWSKKTSKSAAAAVVKFKQLAVAMAALAGVAGTRALLEQADALIKTSDAAGMGFEAYQRLQFALGQSGVSAGGFQKAVNKLNKMLLDASRGSKMASDSLSAIGLSYQQLEGMKPEDRFKAVLGALEGVEDAGKRAALAQELLGKEFANRKINTAGIDAAAKSITVITEEAARASERINDTLAEMSTSAQNKITNLVAPALDRVLDIWRNWDVVMRQVNDFLVAELGIGLQEVFGALNTLWEGFLAHLSDTWEVTKKILKVLWDVVTLDFKQAFEGMGNVLKTVVDKFKERFGGAIQNLTKNLKAQFSWAMETVAVSFTNFFKTAINAVLSPIEMVVNKIVALYNTVANSNIGQTLGLTGGLEGITLNVGQAQPLPSNPGWQAQTQLLRSPSGMPAGAGTTAPTTPQTEPSSLDEGSGSGGSSRTKNKAKEAADKTASTFMDSMKTSLSTAIASGDWKGFTTSVMDNITMTIIDKFSSSLMDSLFGDLNLDAIFDDFGKQFSETLTQMFSKIGARMSGGGGMDIGGLIMKGIGFFTGMPMADGGIVPHTPYSKIGRDSVPAMLMPGELVVPTDEVDGLSKGRGQTIINQNFTGDISRQTRSEMMRSIPEIATAVNQYNRENGIG